MFYLKRLFILLLLCPLVVSCFVDESDQPPIHGYWGYLNLVNDLDYNIIVETNIPNQFFTNNDGGSTFTKRLLTKDWTIDYYSYTIVEGKYSDTTQISSYEQLVSIIKEYVPDPYIAIYRSANMNKGEELGESKISDCKAEMDIYKERPALFQTRTPVIYTEFIIKASCLINTSAGPSS